MIVMIFSVFVAFAVLLWYKKSTQFDKSFEGKTVLITGCATGNIGHAFAKRMVMMAKKIILVALSENLQDVKDELQRLNNRVVVEVVNADLTKESSAQTLFQLVENDADFSHLLLLHCVSCHMSAIDDKIMNEISKNLAVNYVSFARLAHLFVPLVLKRNGKIIITSSMAGSVPMPQRSAYAASKAALTSFFSSIAMEFPKLRIQIVIPAMISTPAIRSLYHQDQIEQARAISPDALVDAVLSSNSTILYVPWFGWIVALLFHIIPKTVLTYIPRFVPKQKSE